MGTNLYPLLYKSGIKRDGTLFQADYCTSGQWVRFQRGTIKKMGGMKGVNGTPAVPTVPIQNLVNVSNIRILPDTTDSSNMIVYIASYNNIYRYTITQDFAAANPAQSAWINSDPNTNNLTPENIWQSEIIIQGNNQQIVYLGSPTLKNINNSAASILLFGTLQGDLEVNNQPKLEGMSGILFTSNFLFIYGANGLVQWSNINNPREFKADNNISVGTDKVVCAKAVRGGINTPTILFWTLTTVVKCINTGAFGSDLEFQKDTLSRSSSILSSRCVVEWDGIFYWPGTDRFFHYNGIVQELSNIMNLNFFFDNIDMNYRQKVVGVKNTKYGEIWWFYPEKGQNEAVGVVNTHAIVFNVRENSWYDTVISRDAAVYSEDFGFMASYGSSITTLNAPTTLYRHEYETYDTEDIAITEQVPVNNNIGSIPVPIISTITTPTISWAAFNPLKQLTGVDRWMSLISVEPDFILMPQDPNDPFTGDMTLVVNTRQYAQDPDLVSTTFNVPSPVPQGGVVPPQGSKVDTAVQGRHITLTFTSTYNFEMGHIMLLLGIGDGQ